MGLGVNPAIGLANARAAAIEARLLIAQDIDPIENRPLGQVADRQALETPSFEEAVQLVYERIAPSFRNSKHRAQWISTLRNGAFPFIGTQRVDLLTTADFGHLLERIWLDKPETASRVKQRCDRIMTGA